MDFSRLLHQTLSFFFFLFFSFSLQSQTVNIDAKPVPESPAVQAKLQHQFKNWEIIQFDPTSLWKKLQENNNTQIKLTFYGETWSLVVEPSGILAPHYTLTIADEKGRRQRPSSPCLALKGYAQNWQEDIEARLTLNKNYFSAYFRKGKEYFYIEPLSHYVDSKPQLFLVYKVSDLLPIEGASCGAVEVRKKKRELAQSNLYKTGNCYEVELAIASDGLMYQKYGSVAGVENHNITVMNNVAGNWDDEFADEIQFIIVEQYVSTSPAADPWTSSTNANTLLNSFTAWGPNGFSQTHDLGQLWTNRDFDGSTVGIAWVGVVCTASRYHCLQDFTSNAEYLRVLTSHEIGHNFDALHDASGSPYIMAPAVSAATQWSSASVTDINAHIAAKAAPNGCLAACPPPAPPVAAFTPNVNPSCPGGMITFFDQSLNSPNSWQWSFPGGSPSSSTEQNPTVTYANPGTYTVNLTATNSNGSNSSSMQISVIPTGGTEFFYFEDFENGMGGWTTVNPDNNTTWVLQSVSGTRQGGQAVFMDNFNYNTNGQRDGLVSPLLDFAGRSSVELEIEYAYARYSASNSDSLVVYISTDGGNTYQWIWGGAENGSGNFATVPDQTTAFSPASTEDWCFATTYGPGCININLSAYDGMSNIRIKIENVNDYGNNMYVDNIRLFSSCLMLNPPIAEFTASPTSGCTPLQVQFTDQSQENPSSWTWSFPGGIPSSSNLQNPSVVYLSPGDYDVTLVVSNIAGTDAITKTNYIHVDGPPQADFSYNINGATVSFTDASSGNPTSWLWSFGDSETSSQQNPTHTYAQDGTYTVALTVTNNCGTSTQFYDLTIITPPTAGFTADPTQGCAPLTVQFTSTASPNTTAWNWSFPGGSPSSSTQENPTVTYNTPGSYTVSLTVSNAAGSDQVTQANYITVNGLPSAAFALITSQDTLFAFNNSTNANDYLWDFGDGSTDTNPNPEPHIYAQEGTYIVSLYATNNCGNDSIAAQINITEPPVAAFSANPTEGCAPLTVQFFDESSDNATSWNWTFEGGQPATSDEQNPIVTYLNPGTYGVTLTASNSAGSNTATEENYITVLGPPTAAFDASINLDTLFLTNNSTDADTYLWYFGDGTTDTTANPQPHIYAQDGTYTVLLTVTNACGTHTTATQITIATPPVAAFSADTTSGCAPLTVQFFDESSDNTTSWNWTFEGGDPATSNEQNPLVTYLNPGTYGVTLTASNSEGSDTATQESYITVLGPPVAAFSDSTNLDTLFLTNNSANADSYFWDFGDGNTDTTANPQPHVYAQDGNYTVTLIVSNSCGSDTTSTQITIITPPVAGFTADTTSGCAPLTVQFSDQSSDNATAWNWTFEGGDPATSTEQNPLVTYLNPGTYGLTLVVSNAAGSDTLSQENYIAALGSPTAGFDANTNLDTLFLTNNSANADSYFWDFGDGNTDTTANPQPHVYAQDGNYTVTLIVSNSCGSDTTSTTITIGTPLIAGFTADTPSGCAPLTVQFSDQSSDNATAWNWTFEGGDPATSTEQNPLVTYLNPGTYGVTLVVSNGLTTDTLSQEDYIAVLGGPTAGFDANTNLDTLFLTNNSSNADSYLWDFGDGNTDTTANPQPHVYAQDGNYTVTLIVSNSCGSDTATTQITITTPPVAGFVADTTSGCAPLTVQFSDQSSDNATAWNWTFEGGDPATSTEQNPLVTYLNPGIYGLTLVVSNAAGSDTLSQENYIAVLGGPTAGFDANTNLDTLFLTNNSTNADSYLWDFGDGNTDTTANPQPHVYAQDGNYTVTLIVSNSCGSDTATTQITITTPPVAGFVADATSGCVPFTVQFSDQSSDNATAWNWTFEGGDPATSTEQNPLVTYLNPGTYGLTLVVSNAAGSDTLSQENYIDVGTPPEVDFTFQINGNLVNFFADTSNANFLLWDFGDGTTSTEQNPQHNYAEDGMYTVTLTAGNECGEAIAQQQVLIATQGPIALFEADVQNGCAPLEVQFTNLSSDNAESFEWHFPGGDPEFSMQQNPSVTYQQAGTYDVTLIAFNDNGSDTLTLFDYITVQDIPQVNFSYTISGATVNFQNNSQGADSYLWDFGDGQTSTQANPSHTYDLAATYTVTLTATNSCGESSISQEISIQLELPVADFEADTTSGCAPLQVQFTDLSQGNPTSWEWTFEGGTPATSTEQNPLVTYDSSGTYSVSLNVSNASGSNMLVQNGYIQVMGMPSADFTYEQDSLTVNFESTSTGADTYFWDFGDGQNSNLMHPSHTYAAGGSYTVTLTVSNACGQSSSEQTLVLTTATTDPTFSSDWRLYPNPNNGDFLLEYTGEALLFDLQVFDLLGHECFAFRQMPAGAGATPQSFQLGTLPAGTYLVKLTAEEKTAYLKMIVQ